MIFRPFLRFDTGCASSVLACGGRVYASFAADEGMRITHVIDAHVHADHESGGPSLAAMTGAVHAPSERAHPIRGGVAQRGDEPPKADGVAP